MNELIDDLLVKLNTRAVSMLCALVLICSGVYMCISDITSTGSINIKAAFVEGRIESGSLGLMAMFLGVLVVLAVNLHKPFKDQEIKLTLNGNEVVGKGLSFRKMKEIVNAASSADVVPESELLPNKENQHGQK